MFKREVVERESIYRDTVPRRLYPLAQASNFLPLTAKLYEPLWRYRSLGILSQGAYSTARELDLLVQWLEPQAGETILDVACSAALYARTLLNAEPDTDLHALDMSLAFLRQAQQRMQQPFTLLHADVHDLPYDDAVFDAVVCGGSLNEFHNLAQAVSEMARVLKPQGRMWQMYLMRSEGFAGKRLQDIFALTGIRFPTRDKVHTLCAQHGLQVQRAEVRGAVVMELYSKDTFSHSLR